MLDNLNSVSVSLINLAVSYGIDILTGFGIILVGFWLSSRLSRFIIQTLSATKRVDKTLIPVFAAIIRYAVIIITIVVALGQVGVQTTSMIAVLGAAGLAIGLALQGTLSNVAAGVMLLLLRPFEVDDWITAAGVSGTVREIGLFSTNIDTFDNVYHSVPNSTIWSSECVMRMPSSPISPNSLTTTAVLRKSGCRKISVSNVDLPLPRKPVSKVTGSKSIQTSKMNLGVFRFIP